MGQACCTACCAEHTVAMPTTNPGTKKENPTFMGLHADSAKAITPSVKNSTTKLLGDGKTCEASFEAPPVHRTMLEYTSGEERVSESRKSSAGTSDEDESSCMKSTAQVEFEKSIGLAELPVLNIAEVLELCGSFELMVEILYQFQEQFIMQQAILKEYLETEDWVEFVSEAHSLKSTTLYLSLGRLTAVADRCMSVGKVCGQLAATNHFPELLCQKQIATHKDLLSVLLLSMQDAFYEFRNELRQFLVYRMAADLRRAKEVGPAMIQ